jgi:hypothetical protein
MPVSTGTFATSAAKLNREELSDAVDLTQRSDTPIYSMIENTGLESTFPEWGVDALDAPGQNIQSEGRDYTFSAADPSDRYGNYTQIMEKEGKFSNTQEAVSKAGNNESITREKVNKGLALRTDVEYSLVASNASVGGTDRVSGSLPTWAETNVSRGAGGANGGFNDGTKMTVAPTDGTQRAFTKALLDELLLSSYSSGAKLNHAFVSPYNKQVFATFMSDTNVAQFRYAAKSGKNTIVADAEVYQGPLGTVYVHPNFVMGGDAGLARNVMVLDTKKIKWGWLRKIAEDKELAKTGDYKKFVLQGEGTLCVKNEKAVGVIADTFGLTATT